MEDNLTTNQVLLCLLALWSLGFWVCGWVANKRGKDMSNIKELMRQEIERRKKENMYVDLPMSIGRYYEDRDLLAFIDSLPEEKPSEDLEEAAARYERENRESILSSVDIVDAFIAGAEWRKKHLTVEDIKTILDLSFWNNDPQKVLDEYNRICATSNQTRR